MSQAILSHSNGDERNTFFKTVSESTVASLTDAPQRLASLPGAPARLSIKKPEWGGRNQGSSPTCATFATLANLEYAWACNDLSEACLTHEYEQSEGDCKAGSNPRDLYEYCKETGIVLERHWPFDSSKVCYANPPDVSGNFRHKFDDFKVLFYGSQRDIVDNMRKQLESGSIHGIDHGKPSGFVDSLKRHLNHHRRPITVAVPVWFSSKHQFDCGWDVGPDIDLPTLENLKTFYRINNLPLPGARSSNPSQSLPEKGFHAVSLCAYDDSKQQFEFKNSWGTGWGNSGFGTFSYDYLNYYCFMALQGT